MEFEAGLAEGPRTATTPLDMIWHTEEERRRGGEGQRSACVEKTCVTLYNNYPSALVSQQTQTLRKRSLKHPFEPPQRIWWLGGETDVNKTDFCIWKQKDREMFRDRQVNRVTASKKGSRMEMTGQDIWRLKKKKKNIPKSDTQTSLSCVRNSSKFICHIYSQMNQPVKLIIVRFCGGTDVSI